MASPEDQTHPTYQAGTKREIVGVFVDQDHLQMAIDELQAHGVNRANYSTVADPRTMARETGHGYVDVRDIEDDCEIPRSVPVSRRSLGVAEGVIIGVAAYVPSLIAAARFSADGASPAMVGAAVLTAGTLGGLLGTILARRLDRLYRARIDDQLDHGGIVLWVSVHSPEQETRVMEVMRAADARDLHAHDLPVMVKPMPGWRGPSYNLSFMRLLGM